MTGSTGTTPTAPVLHPGIVLRVDEDTCLVAGAPTAPVRYAAGFPAPRRERVSPGHLVAIAERPGRPAAVVWRWYDAVVLGAEGDRVRLWEPAHGEVLATPRPGRAPDRPGTRAYLSAGLPGADWWVAGPVVGAAGDARVELDEVGRLYARHGLWDGVWAVPGAVRPSGTASSA